MQCHCEKNMRKINELYFVLIFSTVYSFTGHRIVNRSLLIACKSNCPNPCVPVSQCLAGWLCGLLGPACWLFPQSTAAYLLTAELEPAFSLLLMEINLESMLRWHLQPRLLPCEDAITWEKKIISYIASQTSLILRCGTACRWWEVSNLFFKCTIYLDCVMK